jgi:predicted alpha/beta-hydrolase family hydrolase
VSAFEERPLAIDVDASRRVSGLIVAPADARAIYVFAHGAGAGMTHAFMRDVAFALGSRAIATLRYQFPYMEAGSRRPDVPAVAHAAVRAAVAAAAHALPGIRVFAGGKSFGGRMTSQAQAMEALPLVRGLVFVGFPLHPANAPDVARGRHLADVALPMLFVQGTRDALADLSLLRPLVGSLGARATLVELDAADHSFHVPAKSGRRDDDVIGEIADAMAAWIDA